MVELLVFLIIIYFSLAGVISFFVTTTYCIELFDSTRMPGAWAVLFWIIAVSITVPLGGIILPIMLIYNLYISFPKLKISLRNIIK